MPLDFRLHRNSRALTPIQLAVSAHSVTLAPQPDHAIAEAFLQLAPGQALTGLHRRILLDHLEAHQVSQALEVAHVIAVEDGPVQHRHCASV